MINSVFSTAESTGDAVAEIKANINDKPMAVVYFVSSNYDQEKVAAEMQKAFPDSQLIGCSTAGEIVSGHMLKKGLVAMSLGEGVIEFADMEVISDLTSANSVNAAFDEFEKKLNQPISHLDFNKYVGLVLIDGMSCSEEYINERIGDLTDVLFIGGSAGDDLKFEKTWVHANGKAYNGAAVVALFKTVNGFDILKTESFDTSEKNLIPTKVDEATRTVHEFNGKSAIDAYAEAIGKDKEKAADFFMHNPVGLLVGEEPYVRSPQQVQGDSMVFYCAVKEGMELNVLESRDIVEDTKSDLNKKLQEVGQPKGIINFHCILRTLELEQKDQIEAYAALFNDIPTIGFSTYGETYIGHINQTSTMLLLK